MSDSFIETIWAQFAIETEDHLMLMEQILVAGESNGMTAPDVAALFRSVHSLKGLAKALDLLSMERVAHLSENLMGLVRDGRAELDAPMADLLLEALDALKALREKAVQERSDDRVPEVLVQRLRDAFVALDGEPADSAPGTPRSSAEETAVPLHEDAEMLHFFMQLVADNLPAVEGVLALHASPEQVTAGSGPCVAMQQALANVVRAADVMGFVRIRDVAETIRAQLPESGSIAVSEYANLVDGARELQGLIAHLEHELAFDAGAARLAQQLTAVQAADLDRCLEGIAKDLEVLDLRSGIGPGADEMPVLDRLLSANAMLSCVMPDRCCHLLGFLEDVLREVAKGERRISDAFVEVAQEALALVRQMHGVAASGQLTDPRDPLWVRHDALLQRLRDTLLVDELGGAEPVETLRDFVKSLNITHELAEVLSQENVRELMACVQDGWHVYEVSAHLETSEEVAAEFLEWVHRRGKVITNRSLFIDGQSWYEMLIVSSAGPDEVAAELRAIDSNETLIELKVASGKVQSDREPRRAEPSAAPAPRNASGATAASNFIRVPGETLDSFMNQVGEMVLLRAQLNHIVSDPATARLMLELKSQLDDDTIGRRQGDGILVEAYDLLQEQSRRLAEADAQIHSALSRLQERAMALRVVPVETVFNRFPRVVRDLAQAQGKRIRLEMIGQEVRIDKAMVEVLADPLMHMVRNSVDHGIESPEERETHGKKDEAQVSIKASQQGNRVIVQVTDDGRGIDPERVRRKAVERGLVQEADSHQLTREEIYNFLFVPGFSTAQKITETSGRGVGMDVVRTNVMRLGGSIQIQSEVGAGSTFSLEMPLSAAVQDVMLVSAAGQTLALPGRYVAEVIEIDGDDIQSIKGRQAILLRGSFLPLVHLGDVLGFDGKRSPVAASLTAVVVSNGQEMMGVIVDRMVGRRELFMKEIHPRLAQLPGVGGASILGDGRVVLVLDGEALFRLAESACLARDLRTPMLQAA